MTCEVMAARRVPPQNARMNTAIALPPAASMRPFGEHLRQWRQHRRLSQFELAVQADISPRHLSFVETGRSAPSREMVLRLAARLDVPLRERNTLLVAAGYAPMYRQRALDDPDLVPARRAVETILRSLEPYPALAIDRHWNLVTANAVVPHLLAAADPALLQGTVNVLRLSLHPRGLAPSIVYLAQWRAHLFERLAQQIEATADGELIALRDELLAYPVPAGGVQLAGEQLGIAMPLRLRTAGGELGLISTTTIFGTPVDVTLQELALETFFPADARSGELLRRLAV
jgi:transcriptional regulator with XRE-family HTH domain